MNRIEVTPVSAWACSGSLTIADMIIATFQGLVVLLLARLLGYVPLGGPVGLLLAALFLAVLAVAVVGLGLIIFHQGSIPDPAVWQNLLILALISAVVVVAGIQLFKRTGFRYGILRAHSPGIRVGQQLAHRALSTSSPGIIRTQSRATDYVRFCTWQHVLSSTILKVANHSFSHERRI